MPNENNFLKWDVKLQTTKQMSSFTQLNLLSEASFENKKGIHALLYVDLLGSNHYVWKTILNIFHIIINNVFMYLYIYIYICTVTYSFLSSVLIKL